MLFLSLAATNTVTLDCVQYEGLSTESYLEIQGLSSTRRVRRQHSPLLQEQELSRKFKFYIYVINFLCDYFSKLVVFIFLLLLLLLAICKMINVTF